MGRRGRCPCAGDRGAGPHHRRARCAAEARAESVGIRRQVRLPTGDTEELGTGPDSAGWTGASASSCDRSSPGGRGRCPAKGRLANSRSPIMAMAAEVRDDNYTLMWPRPSAMPRRNLVSHIRNRHRSVEATTSNVHPGKINLAQIAAAMVASQTAIPEVAIRPPQYSPRS